ncbi:hypothetical protein BDBG_17917, partial [Blastomyces gilchristii SLH14081]
SSHVDRFTFTDDSELNVESLIKNLKNAIMKELFISCVTESSAFFPVSSVSSSAAPSQSSTPASVSGSLTSATPVSVILTFTTSALSGFAVSAFIISSPHFKKILCRLDESYFSRITSLLNSIKIVITLVSEVILIEDDNITETIFFHSQASLIAFSLFSAEKVMCIPGC